jgi:hypothetical protein
MVIWEIPKSRADAIVAVLNAARALTKTADHALHHYARGRSCVDCDRLRSAVGELDG